MLRVSLLALLAKSLSLQRPTNTEHGISLALRGIVRNESPVLHKRDLATSPNLGKGPAALPAQESGGTVATAPEPQS